MHRSSIMDPDVSRRRFIRSFVLGTAFSSLLGKEWISTVIADCAPVAAGAGILQVKISEFPALQSDNGSIRLALNNFTQNGASGAFYPILVNRTTGNTFFSLNSRCTHQACVVPVGGGPCPCHGSLYDLDGSVLNGPATSALAKYKNSFDGVDTLCIEVPGLGFAITTSKVETGTSPRLRLQFPTRSGVKYEVRFRESVADAGTVVPFSTTESGAAATVVLNGNNAVATVYVDRTTAAGFYSVVVQVTER